MNRPEEALQRSIVTIWRVIGRKDVMMQADATGLVGAKRRGIAAGLGTRAGWPDLTFIAPGGVAYFAELKAPKGRLSPAQKEFRDWCIDQKVPYLVCSDVDTIRAWWKAHGLSREVVA